MMTRTLAAVVPTVVLLTGVAVQAEGSLEEARAATSTKVYFVGDLLGLPPGKAIPKDAGIDMTPVIQLITSTVARDTWRTSDTAPAVMPVGSITPFFLSQSVIIRHTDEVHKEVGALLRGLRGLPALQGRERQ
jgi:hypothetical protein